MSSRILADKPAQTWIIIPGPRVDQPGLGIADVAQCPDEPLAAAGGAAFGEACEAVLAIPGACSAAGVRERGVLHHSLIPALFNLCLTVLCIQQSISS